MKVLVIENCSLGPAGIVGRELAAGGVTVTAVNVLEQGDILPAHQAYDGVVVLGGPMGAFDDSDYPGIPSVIDLLRQFHAAGKAILGICLGAQLLARALGETYKSNNGWEIGYVPLHITGEGRADPLLADWPGDGLRLMAWHQDNFNLPADARLLMTGEKCINQAFRAGRASYGVQFHPEVDGEILRRMVASEEAGDYASAEKELMYAMLDDFPRCFPAAEAFARDLTARWRGLLA